MLTSRNAPGYFQITGNNGKTLDITEDGKLPVEVSIDSVTATDVTIKDATNETQKLKVNADGSIPVQLTGSNAQVDGSTTPPIQNMLFNGTNWDRWRNNTEGTLLASASRSATTTSPKQTNYNARGVNIYLNITAIPNDAAQKLTVFVREFDPVSGLPRVLTSFEIAGNVSPRVHLFKIYPGIVETSDIGDLYTQGLNLGRTWDIQIWHIGSGAWTYSVGYSYTL